MASKFGDAFATARKAGKKTFMFGGKEYTTELAKDTPKEGPVPERKPTTPAQKEELAGKLREQAASQKTSRLAEHKDSDEKTAKKEFSPNMKRMLAPADEKLASRLTPSDRKTSTAWKKDDRVRDVPEEKKKEISGKLKEQAASRKKDRIKSPFTAEEVASATSRRERWYGTEKER